jgi:UDP-4-amino-4,6-dideoxy-N-acetyl-beta-L-altrosamine transaminase
VIPYGRQEITQEDIDSVVSVLQSDFLTQGPTVPKFENGVADYCRVKHGVATNSATSSLHVACLALGLGEGDWLWTTPITFVASANCGLYCGAKVDFVDIDPPTFNMCPIALEHKLQEAEKTGRLPKIVIPVHMCGQSCDMEAIHKLSKQYGFKIIEDASHAIGGKYKNEPVGNCKYSDITVFSFHPVKIITTGEGGMAMTNSTELADTMQLLRSHGVTRDASKMIGDSDGEWYYQQISLGFNYRMTEMQAALGISQMQRLNKFVDKRHKLRERYDLLLDSLPMIKPYQDQNCYSALHLYPIQIDASKTTKKRKEIFNKLRENGIGVNVHYIPVHTQPYYQQLGFKSGDFPNAESYYSNTISLPIFYSMTNEQQDEVVLMLKEIFK